MKKIVLIALVFAALTGFSVYKYAGYLRDSTKTETSFVVCAARTIPENTLITQDMVELREFPSASIHKMALRDLTLASGRITNATIEAGEPLLSSRLEEIGADKGGLAFYIPAGKRALTIEVDDISGVAGYLKRSNHIDVIASLMTDQQTADGKTEKVTRSMLLLQNTEILAISTENSDPEKEGYTNITLAVTPEEAVKLFYAQTSGKLTVMLRPVLETETRNVPPYSP